MKDTCTIAILNYNASAQLIRAIESVRRFAPDMPLVIWDNNSSDTSVSDAEKAAPDATIIASPTNLWFARGCNAAIAACKTPFVFLMNADVFLEESSNLEYIIEYMTANPDLVATSPAIRDSGKLRHQAHNSITPLMCIARDTFAGKPLRRTKWYRNANHSDHAANEVFFSEKITNCCCMIRRNTFLKTGGFDTRLILYWTEEEFGRRCSRLGLKQAVFGHSTACHQHGGSTKSVDKLLIRAIYTYDRLTYMRVNFGFIRMLAVEILMILRPTFWHTLRDYYGIILYRRKIKQALLDVKHSP